MTAALRLVPLLAITVAAVFVAGPTQVAAGGGGCHEEPSPRDASGDTVVLQRHCFGPSVLRVEPGTEVAFRNHDMTPHHISGVAMTWASDGDINEGDVERFVFEEPGLYPYTCYYHPGMSGVIVVGDGVSTDARAEVNRSISQSADGSQQVSKVASGVPVAEEPVRAAAAVAPPGGTDDNPLLFAALGAIIGAVTVSVVVAGQRMRSGR